MYLCTFGSPQSKISSWGNPLSNLSNTTSLIKIGFSNEELCQISHDDLSIYEFSRVNLYDVPWVTVATLGSENDTQTNYSPSSFCNFLWKFSLMLRATVITILPRSPIWKVIRESGKTLTSSDHISAIQWDKPWNLDPKFKTILAQMGVFFSFWSGIEKNLQRKFHDDLFGAAKP